MFILDERLIQTVVSNEGQKTTILDQDLISSCFCYHSFIEARCFHSFDVEGKWITQNPDSGCLYFLLIFGNPLNDTLGECTDAENEKTSDEVLPVSEGLYLNNNNKASVSALSDILVGLLNHHRPVTNSALSRIVLFFCFLRCL